MNEPIPGVQKFEFRETYSHIFVKHLSNRARLEANTKYSFCSPSYSLEIKKYIFCTADGIICSRIGNECSYKTCDIYSIIPCLLDR